jgi:hypothetical protein
MDPMQEKYRKDRIHSMLRHPMGDKSFQNGKNNREITGERTRVFYV